MTKKGRHHNIIWSVPPEVVVFDEPGSCVYLPGRVWRLPLRTPLRRLSRDEMDRRLAQGDRRQGRMLYRTACPSCTACEPVRVDVERFRARRTQRRVWRKGQALIDTEICPVQSDAAHIQLYNLHRDGRGFDHGSGDLDIPTYRMVLADSCCESFELRYSVGGAVMGVALVDRAETSLSAVYTYYDPAFGYLSPGIYSVLRQLELCREWGLRHLYLGLYVADCPAMRYKGGYHPQERLMDGGWRDIAVEPPGWPDPEDSGPIEPS